MDPFTLLLSAIGDAGSAALDGASSLGSSLSSALSPGTAGASALPTAGDTASKLATSGTANTPLAQTAAAASTPPKPKSFFDGLMGTDPNQSTGANFGKILGSLKASPGAKPQFSGGFQGPQLPQTHQISSPDLITQLSSVLSANKPQTLGQLLAGPRAVLRA